MPVTTNNLILMDMVDSLLSMSIYIIDKRKNKDDFIKLCAQNMDWSSAKDGSNRGEFQILPNDRYSSIWGF